MPHLSLARAREGAENITHHKYPGLRLKAQFGRCFVLNHRQVLSAATTWEQALEHLLQAEVVRFVQRNGLEVPPVTEFSLLAELYLNSPDTLIKQFSRRGKASEVSTQQPTTKEMPHATTNL